ncbi:rhamnose ABC transporter substrate-binding protein [Enterococcus casseliflavus]|jgi:monosaccharide ABC transporter substrate-binding protein, CUT2 family (TC 3.A.1.2.-)|uniref:rhamnose ABC transporter substrate-binding protein n=1 Tax=Enterococcus casseliflavus TaxID=37734 RepID=UPI0022E87DAF|nr:rhamnose ABC transporter substrate-binding protein [Enterococcus casseliflavus]MDB1692775.1 rhamnose ABC transporter substrate-binding protein [Enterococcus casseliflavus]MEB6087409.1 rhamnose ABC transporter substrate-binding protein [Enterococcus casseliflavus]
MKLSKWIGLSIATAVMFLAACGDGQESAGNVENSSGTYAIVAKSAGNPFNEKQIEGFKKAIEEQGYQVIEKTPDQPTAEQQINIIQELITQGVDGIAIAANDENALQPALKQAMDLGIAVTSFDSAVNQESRQAHVNQADPKAIAVAMMDAVLDLAGGEGQFAILSATSTATNQNTWIAGMEELMAEDEKYAGLELVKIAYGDDLRDKSTSETEALLQSFPDLRVIMSPSTVGIAAAAKVVQDKGVSDNIKVTGLGLPSEMAAYIDNDVCPYMYLWNPIDIGYMTGYLLTALAQEDISGSVGETFEAGDLGTKEITEAPDGGTESFLGEPFRFDSSNIDEWKEVY